MLRAFVELLWPLVGSTSPQERQSLVDEENAEIEGINEINVATESEIALSVANDIYKKEEERVRTSESKAFNLMLVAAALLPLLTYFEDSIWQGKLGSAPKWLSLIFLVIGVFYLLSASYWALRSVNVRTFHTIGPMDLAAVLSNAKPTESLAKAILTNSVRNRQGTNKKITFVTLAMAFLLRTIFAFGVLLFILAGWELWILFAPVLRKLVCG